MGKLFVYIVKRTDEVGYDQYDGFVCVAASPSEAVALNPCRATCDGEYCEWPVAPSDLTLEMVGQAGPDQNKGIIFTSYKAG